MEEPKTTNDAPVKIKDPRKVAQGKKLGEISREAKAKKKMMLESQRSEEETIGYVLPLGLAVVGVSAVGYLLYQRLYRPAETREGEMTDHSTDRSKDVSPPNRSGAEVRTSDSTRAEVRRGSRNLESFD